MIYLSLQAPVHICLIWRYEKKNQRPHHYKSEVEVDVDDMVIYLFILLVQMQNLNKDSEKKFLSDCQLATQSALPPTLC